MLKLSVDAQIPLVSVSTDDMVNLGLVLETLLGQTIMFIEDTEKPFELSKNLTRGNEYQVFYTKKDVEASVETYNTLQKLNKTLIYVNSNFGNPLVLNSGVLTTPKELIRDLLDNVVSDENMPQVVGSLNGLSLKDIWTVSQLASAKYNEVTPKSIRYTRALLMDKMSGLQQLDTDLPLYIPYAPLEAWITMNEKYFRENVDYRLVPRGLVLAGDRGTGKTCFAKYLANKWGVNLFKLDIPTLLGKYVGESETNFFRVLQTVDNEEPLILLIDEADKLFFNGNDDSSGVSQHILSITLYWMAEHRTRVFTILTTNNLAIIPKELYRDRRIDKVFEIPCLGLDEAEDLALKVAATIIKVNNRVRLLIKSAIQHEAKARVTDRLSPATITQLVYDKIKENNLA